MDKASAPDCFSRIRKHFIVASNCPKNRPSSTNANGPRCEHGGPFVASVAVPIFKLTQARPGYSDVASEILTASRQYLAISRQMISIGAEPCHYPGERGEREGSNAKG